MHRVMGRVLYQRFWKLSHVLSHVVCLTERVIS